MGYMLDGEWYTGWYEPDEHGRFQRTKTKFHGRIGSSRFPAQPDRYHLYASYACPWAHRTLITRHLKGLGHAIGISVVDPRMGDDGWVFGDYPRSTADQAGGATMLRQKYKQTKDDYSGRVTVPVLWDTREGTIVNNESREIMRMLDHAFDDLAGVGGGRSGIDLCPPDLRARVDATLDEMYEPINNGVYRAGFAGSQAAYDEACRELFEALDRYDRLLAQQRYLCGSRLTEADIALYTTLVRFDLVYYSHFKCNLARIADFPNLHGYLLDLYQTPGFGQTTDLEHIKVHYYWSQTTVNPTRIVPLGPKVDFTVPHARERLSG